MKISKKILVSITWVLFGLKMGKDLGYVPGQITFDSSTSIDFWAWAILWPVWFLKHLYTLLVSTFSLGPMETGAWIVVMMIVAFSYWNWEHLFHGDKED